MKVMIMMNFFEVLSEFENCCLLSTTGGSDLEDNKFVAQISTIMRMLTS